MVPLLVLLAPVSAYMPGAVPSLRRTPPIELTPCMSANFGPDMIAALSSAPSELAAPQLSSVLSSPTLILAAELRKGIKSEADEILDDFFSVFPFLFGSAALALLVLSEVSAARRDY